MNVSIKNLLPILLITSIVSASSGPIDNNIPESFVAREDRSIPPRYLLSANSLQKKITSVQKEIVLVDVRNSHQFEKFRIPGSLNISLFAIKTGVWISHRSFWPT